MDWTFLKTKPESLTYLDVGHSGPGYIWWYDAGTFYCIKMDDECQGHIDTDYENFTYSGRYCIETNTLSFSSIEDRIPSRLVQDLQRRFPKAKLIDFSCKQLMEKRW